MDDIPIDTPLEKTDFLFASRYQLQISSLLGVGPHFQFSSALGLLLTCTCYRPKCAAKAL